VIRIVAQNYVHPIRHDQLTKDALKGMLARLDPHSDYMDEQEFKETTTDISGQFGGLGIEISEQEGVPKVISPIDGTPAAEAGLEPGDLIVSIDGKATHGIDLIKIVGTLRGKPGTQVTLSVSRGTKAPFEVTLTRRIIHVQSVKSEMKPNGIGYVRISEFLSTTPRELSDAIQKLKAQAGEMNGLVLDLRNDPGGLLSSAVSVAGDFLDSGKVVTIHGRRSDDEHTFNVPAGGHTLLHTPMVTLINGASASASEIVAGALQDRHRSTIMGTESFGKGSVQTIIPLEGYGALRLTTALYYTPSGRSIQGHGIAPDIVVEAPKEEEVSGAVPHESTLQGAFQNPGPLNAPTTPRNENGAPPGSKAEAYSRPIQSQLIDSAKDGQLTAALAYLNRESASVTGRR
jgi:carboxyl-terminal processing protease